MIPITPAIAIAPTPIILPYSLKINSGSLSLNIIVPSVVIPNNGITKNQTKKEPAQMIRLYFKPIIKPRPRTAALVFNENCNFNFWAIPSPQGIILEERVSLQAPKLETRKSYNPPTNPAINKGFACPPPFSPETNT